MQYSHKKKGGQDAKCKIHNVKTRLYKKLFTRYLRGQIIYNKNVQKDKNLFFLLILVNDQRIEEPKLEYCDDIKRINVTRQQQLYQLERYEEINENVHQKVFASTKICGLKND